MEEIGLPKSQNKMLADELDNQKKIVKQLHNSINIMHYGWSSDKDKLGEAINKLNQLENCTNKNNDSKEFHYNAEKNITEEQDPKTKKSAIKPRKSEKPKELPLKKAIKFKNQKNKGTNKKITYYNTPTVVTRKSLLKNKFCEEIINNCDENKGEIQKERQEIQKGKERQEILEGKESQEIQKEKDCQHNKPMIVTRNTISKKLKPEEIKSNVYVNKLVTQTEKEIKKKTIQRNTPTVITRQSLLKNKVCEEITSNYKVNQDEIQNEKLNHEVLNKKESCYNTPTIATRHTMPENRKSEEIKGNADITKLVIKKEMERFFKFLENSPLLNESFEEIKSNYDASQEKESKKLTFVESGVAKKSSKKKIWDERESSPDFSTMDDCDWDMTANDSLRETEPGTIPCPLCCDELFSTQESLKYHLLSILENVFCPVCSRRYDNIMSLVTHLGNGCDGKPKYDSDVEDMIEEVCDKQEYKKQDPVLKTSEHIINVAQNALAIISFKTPDQKIFSNGICISKQNEDYPLEPPAELPTEMDVDTEDFSMSEDEIMSEEHPDEIYPTTEENDLNPKLLTGISSQIAVVGLSSPTKVNIQDSELNKKQIKLKSKKDVDEIYQISEENNLNSKLYVDMTKWIPSSGLSTVTNVNTQDCNLNENKIMLKFKKHLYEVHKMTVEVASTRDINEGSLSILTSANLYIETKDGKLNSNQISSISKEHKNAICKQIMFQFKNNLNEICKMAVEDVLKSAACGDKISSLPSAKLSIATNQDCNLNKKEIMSQLKKRLNLICKRAIQEAFNFVERSISMPKHINIQDSNSNKHNHLMLRFAKLLNNIYQMAVEKNMQSKVDAEKSSANVDNLDPEKIVSKSEKSNILEKIYQMAVEDEIKSPSNVLDNHNKFIKDDEDTAPSLSEDVETNLDEIMVDTTKPTEIVDSDYLCSACDMTFTSISDHIVQYHMGEEVQVQGPPEELEKKLAQWNVIGEKEDISVSNQESKQQPDQNPTNEINQQLNKSTNEKSDPKSNQISVNENTNPSTAINSYWIKNKTFFKYISNVEKIKLLDPLFIPPLYKINSRLNSEEVVPKGLFSIMKKQYLWLDKVNLIQLAKDKDLTPFMDRSLDKLRVYVVDQKIPIISNSNLGPTAKIIDQLPEVSKYLKSGGDNNEKLHVVSETDSDRNSHKFYFNQFIQVVEVEVGDDKEITIENLNFKRIPTIPEHIVPFIDTIDVPLIPLLRKARMLKWRCMLCHTPRFTIDSALQHTCYRCEFCNERLVRSFCAVRNHLLEMHSTKCPANYHIGNKLEKKNEKPTSESEKAEQGRKLTSCSYCNCGYSYQETFEYHLSLGTKSLVQCHICKNSINKADLELHLKWHEENKYCCGICNRHFDNEVKYNVHKEMHRGKTNDFKCHICNESFRNSYMLKFHSLQHDGTYRPHACNFCSKRFKGVNEKVVHERIHTNERPYICTVCGKGFGKPYNRFIHMKRHNQKKDFKCDICDKEFVFKNDLIVHLGVHNEGKPYKCTLCGLAFKTQVSLAGHKRRHTSLYKCPYCPLSFKSLTGCKRHVAIHETNKKAIHCEHCPAVFLLNHLVIRHMKEEHGVEPEPRPVKPVKKMRKKSEDENTSEWEETNENEKTDSES